jgi:hypothetical protein
MFFLRPSALTNQIVTYCLALAAHVANVEVHAVCVMSNHWCEQAWKSDPLACIEN